MQQVRVLQDEAEDFTPGTEVSLLYRN